ncbi:hypothetical protein C7Y47_24325 [Lysinibacillus sphaericus]|uniref:Uncharacterized protein n=1 Tax=Lysinibacillus sphaericus TaxID=1421 RepID=A0A544U770_LYSSH|nr:hypothetical protein [Lysinibacillus sp. SDF0037]TQR26670.1 hypothetical protein C7Y47_24325 [Lysinibacillus sp. SDF0037]
MITTRNSTTMQYLMSRRSYKQNGLTQKNSNDRTSKESQERINNVNKIIEESKRSKLSTKQIETLKSTAKDGLLGSSTNKLGPWGQHSLQKFLSNSKYNSTLNAYRNSI